MNNKERFVKLLLRACVLLAIVVDIIFLFSKENSEGRDSIVDQVDAVNTHSDSPVYRDINESFWDSESGNGDNNNVGGSAINDDNNQIVNVGRHQGQVQQGQVQQGQAQQGQVQQGQVQQGQVQQGQVQQGQVQQGQVQQGQVQQGQVQQGQVQQGQVQQGQAQQGEAQQGQG